MSLLGNPCAWRLGVCIGLRMSDDESETGTGTGTGHRWNLARYRELNLVPVNVHEKILVTLK
jgi:hypothetical protein